MLRSYNLLYTRKLRIQHFLEFIFQSNLTKLHYESQDRSHIPSNGRYTFKYNRMLRDDTKYLNTSDVNVKRHALHIIIAMTLSLEATFPILLKARLNSYWTGWEEEIW